MKVTLRTDEITLSVDGKEMTFSEKELISILKEHFKSEESKVKEQSMEIEQRPTEGKLFKVDPLSINQELFKKKRSDSRKEATRQYILEAFEEVKKNSKYAKPFKTLMPEKTWYSKTVSELKELAGSLGDHNADWVEQALEWAQRIANGESWEDICNKADTANWYRIVVWKGGYARLVGGSRNSSINYPACDVNYNYCVDDDYISGAVPLVVLYE